MSVRARIGRWCVCLLVCACGVVQGEATGKQAKTRVIYHDDAQSLAEAPAEGTEEFLREFLAREAAMAPVTTFCYLAATPDVCTYDTKAGEVYGDRLKEASGWAVGIRALRAQGTDVLKVVCSELRGRGLEVLATVRMNDTHHRSLDPSNPGCPQFALDHPEYVIKQPDGRTNETALDYSHEAVRAHRLAIMRELAEDYDIDGLELNFCRWAKHFPRDQGRAKAGIMTAYVGRIRQMLDEAARKRGRSALTLGMRVPEGIEPCWLAGLDPKTWVEKGWIDYLVVSTWNETDPQIRVDEFSGFTKGTKCQLLVAMGNMMGGTWRGLPKVSRRGVAQFRDSYSGMLLTAAEARACANNYYCWGADGVSFWNISCNMGTQGKFSSPAQRERMQTWMHAVVNRDRVAAGARRYHYLPLYKFEEVLAPPLRNYPWYGQGRSPLGGMKMQMLRFPENKIGERQVYRFRMADGRSGEKLQGLLRFVVFHIGADDRVAVDVNGQAVEPTKIRPAALDVKKTGLPGMRFEIALADCPPFRGDNELGITLQTKAKRKAEPTMEELDIVAE